jgi:ATP-binding cassette subfamily B multidrug efflux pump
MAEFEYGYLEGDHLGRPQDLGLLLRLYPYLRPHLRLMTLASLLILVLIGLELAMPYITRLAIDRHLVPHYLRIDPTRLGPELKSDLARVIPADRGHGAEGSWWLAKSRWRELDPALATLIHKSGAVGRLDWYRTAATPEVGALARQHQAWFTKAGDDFFIPVERLSDLSADELGILRVDDAQWLGIWAAIFASLALCLLGVSYFQTMALEKAGQGMVHDLRMDLYASLLERPLAFFHANPMGKLVTRLNNDVQNLADLFRGLLVGLFRDLFLLVGVAGIMLHLDWRLGLICLGLGPLVALLAWRLSLLTREIFRRVQGLVGRISTLLGEVVSGISQVKLLGAETALLGKLTRLNQEHFRAGMAQVKLFAVFLPLVELLGSLAVALIIWQGGGWVIQDRLSLGTLVAFIAYFQMFMAPIRDLAEKYHTLQGALASTERILVLMATDQEQPPLPATPVPPMPSSSGDLEFCGVEFGFRPGRPVLKDFNLRVAEGRSLAVVGPSGGGKSTLVNLALRLYRPWAGRIMLGGRELNSLSQAELSGLLALVSQESLLLRSSVALNVSLGRPGVDKGRLYEALDISGVSAWLSELPQGADTMIGPGGRQLSQGQRQMVALARALAGDPKVLLLDEAFSQVDPASEAAIHRALPLVMAGRTTIMVAHRLSTARQAERILVMQQGKLVEDGDHTALLKAGGLYAYLAGLEAMEQEGREPSPG